MQEELTPYGYCQCGCGKRTTIAKLNDTFNGRVKGEPMRFVVGHNVSHSNGSTFGPEWVAEDRGFDTPCWIWQRRATWDGYGLLTRQGERHFAHRASWSDANGPIPDGLQIDHLCAVRACVNPAHLEPVTLAENGRRRSERMKTCLRGHPRVPENLRTDKHGYHTCRICTRITTRARILRARAAAEADSS